MIRRQPRSTQRRSSAASDVYKRQGGALDAQQAGGGGDLERKVELAAGANGAGDERLPLPLDRDHRAGGGDLVESERETCLLYTSPSPRDS